MSSISAWITENPSAFFRLLLKIVLAVTVIATFIIKKVTNKLPDKKIAFLAGETENGFVVENQYGRYRVECEQDFCSVVQAVFNDENQFATLTAPEAINSVKYVQACLSNREVEVQIGLDFYNKTELYYKMCSPKETLWIFKDFYNNRFVPDMSEYRPVRFVES